MFDCKDHTTSRHTLVLFCSYLGRAFRCYGCDFSLLYASAPVDIAIFATTIRFDNLPLLPSFLMTYLDMYTNMPFQQPHPNSIFNHPLHRLASIEAFEPVGCSSSATWLCMARLRPYSCNRLGCEFAWFQCCVYSHAHSTAEQANCAIIVRLVVCVLRRVPLFFLRKLRWLETTSGSILFKRLEP